MFKPEGVYSVMVTPFKQDGSIDLDAIRELTRFYVESGVHGVLTLGSGGESAMLNDGEMKQVIDTVVDEVDGKTKVIAGTGAPSTRRSVELTKYAKDAGADASAVVTPYFYHVTPVGLKDHFISIAQAAEFPIVIYSIPLFSPNKFTPDMLFRFSKEEYLVGIKDSSGSPFDLLETLRLAPEGFSVLVGWDSLIMSGLEMGAKGAMVGSAGIAPKLVLELYEACVEKRYDEARELQRRIHYVMRGMFVGTYPAAIKAALKLLNLPGGYVRKPLEDLKTSEMARVRFDLERAKVLEQI